jgi:hypothetical protein
MACRIHAAVLAAVALSVPPALAGQDTEELGRLKAQVEALRKENDELKKEVERLKGEAIDRKRSLEERLKAANRVSAEERDPALAGVAADAAKASELTIMDMAISRISGPGRQKHFGRIATTLARAGHVERANMLANTLKPPEREKVFAMIAKGEVAAEPPK